MRQPINPFRQSMPYHDRRAAREDAEKFLGWWRCIGYTFLVWLLALVLGYALRAAIQGSGS